MILLGRDVPEVHHIYDQITGPVGSPFAQKLPLGWVVVGDLCLNKMRRPNTVKVMKRISSRMEDLRYSYHVKTHSMLAKMCFIIQRMMTRLGCPKRTDCS